MDPVVRDWFVGALERYFPRALPGYLRVYGATGTKEGMRYAPKAYASRIAHTVRELKERYGLSEQRRPVRVLESSLHGAPLASVGTGVSPGPRQMALPL